MDRPLIYRYLSYDKVWSYWHIFWASGIPNYSPVLASFLSQQKTFSATNTQGHFWWWLYVSSTECKQANLAQFLISYHHFSPSVKDYIHHLLSVPGVNLDLGWMDSGQESVKCNNKYFADTACTQQARGTPATAIYIWSCREAKDTSASLFREFNSRSRSTSVRRLQCSGWLPRLDYASVSQALS